MIEQTFGLLTAWVAGAFLLRFDAGQVGRLGVGTGREEGGPAREGAARARRDLGRTVDEGQKSFSTHSSHFGRRATQTPRPCRIRRSDSAVHSSRGTIQQTW